MTISLAGKQLTFLERGGEPADLLPGLGGEFIHARRLDAQIAFKIDDGSLASAFTITDSSGVDEAKRVD